MNPVNHDLIQVIRQSTEMNIPEEISDAEMKEKLSYYINDMIQNNFQKLVAILYRIDVSETKLKGMLKENPDRDAGKLIADLIIERQLQKIKSRRRFSQRNSASSDEEEW